MTDGLATIREVSQALRISVRQVYRIVAEGHLAIIKIGAATRIEWADVRAYLDRMKRRQRRR